MQGAEACDFETPAETDGSHAAFFAAAVSRSAAAWPSARAKRNAARDTAAASCARPRSSTAGRSVLVAFGVFMVLSLPQLPAARGPLAQRLDAVLPLDRPAQGADHRG
jgi:hypothetical protein